MKTFENPCFVPPSPMSRRHDHHLFLSSLFLPNPSPNSELLLPALLSFLYACRSSLRRLNQAHALLVVSGAAGHMLVVRRLVGLACRPSAGTLDYALLIQSQLPTPDSVVCNHILKSLVRRSRPPDAVAFYCRRAHPAGCRPNLCTFPILIAAAKHCGSLHQGEAFHSHALTLGFLCHRSVANSLLHMYASCDALDLARQLFDEMPDRDRISYNSMIHGYVQSADLDEAEELFWKMPKRNVVSWSTLINGYVRNRMFKKGLVLFRKMQEHRVDLDDSIIVTLLSIYAHFKLGLYGRSVHGFLIRNWSKMPIHVSSAVVDCYCKSGLLDAATTLFNRIRNKDLICWNTLISGLGSHGRGQEGLNIFSKMLQKGVKPDDITFINVLVGCAHSGLVDDGLRMFAMMSSEFGIKPSFAHHWCLIDLFVRVGRPYDALKVIQEMPLDNHSSIWGAVIWLAKVVGDTRVGEYLGKRLIELEPDNSRRYVPLINLYAAASSWDKYRELQDEMRARGLKKLPDCTLIDLNVVAHKFSVGDKSQPEIENIYNALEKIAEQLKLQPRGAEE